MKKILTLAIVLATAAFSLEAIAQKFGHVDSNELLLAMPERKTAETSIQDYAKQLESQLKTMNAEWESKVQDYQSKEAMLSDAIKKTKVKEITDLESRIKDFQTTAQEDLQKKENDLLQPMIEKAKAAINEVAKENKYTYVFDSGAGMLLYSPESDDILPLVKKKMGIK
ncbi:MAG: OmpH family outer membrane protein [Bacteroidetes bacterium]|nr:OmpH family outer membrane protein [Bacteroidota bacterium]HET6245515.1 OmpH family outer membrane protein [Bacteroidia bacterium]